MISTLETTCFSVRLTQLPRPPHLPMPQVLSVFRGFHTEGVCQVCFSPDGQVKSVSTIGNESFAGTYHKKRICTVNKWPDHQCCAECSKRILYFFLQCRSCLYLGLLHQLLVSVGRDAEHSVAVFHWQTRATLFTAPSGPEDVLGCHVVHENLFVSCGIDHLRLWSRVGGSFELEQGERVPSPVLFTDMKMYCF